jgi:hypothetical protein
MNGVESIRALIKSGKSLARFSDGAFDQLNGGGIYSIQSNYCQKWSKELQSDMIKVLSATDERLMVAVDPPSTFLSQRGARHNFPYEYNMWIDMKRQLWKYLNKENKYGHSHLFIPKNCPEVDWYELLNFLNTKNIIIATGNIDKLPKINFGKNIYKIECGMENAYERKNKILKNIIECVELNSLQGSDLLVMLSLGPTAPIIVFDLMNKGICAWDTGHFFKFADQIFLHNE